MSALSAATFVVLTACGLNPSEDVAADRVDLVEVNHFYDDQGRLVFDQLIFYDWSPLDGRHQVRAWRLVRNPAQFPQRSWPRGGYTCVWHDGDVLRKVHALAIRETFTQHDPELTERDYLPKELRRELTQLRAAKK